MNSRRRHLELLRKRYRLPISLLTHETPPGSPLREIGFDIEASADARGKLKVTGLVTCIEDARDLTNKCDVRGIDKLCIRYADYVSLWCVDSVKQHIRAVCDGGGDSAPLKVVILNPGVPKEKARLRAKLDTLFTKLSDVLSLADNGNTPRQRQRLEDLHSEIAMALEKATVHAASAEIFKKSHLDWLLLLELSADAPSLARQEGIWLLKHLHPAEHASVLLDGEVDAAALAVVHKRIQDRVNDREDVPSSFNLHQARQNLLGAVGRHHLEANLVVALGKACAVMDQYFKEEVTMVKVSEIIRSQLDGLRIMMCKRSLIGCRFIDLDGDIEDDTEDEENAEDSGHEGSIQGDYDPKYTDDKIIFVEYEDDDVVLVQDEAGNAFLYDYDDEEDGMSGGSENSVDSPVKAEPAPKEETPISASSFVSTYSEIGDADFSLLLNLEYSDEDKYQECNLEKSGKLPGAQLPELTDAPCASTTSLSPSSNASASPAPAASSALRSMNEIIDKYNTHSKNLGKAEEPSLDLNDEICRSISESGGIDVLLQCIDEAGEQKNKVIASSGCSLLFKLAASDANKSVIIQRGGFGRFLKLTSRFSEDPAIIQEVMSMVTVLTLRSPENAARAMEVGYGTLAIQSMERFPSSDQTQKQACLMISNLVVRNPENRTILLNDGAEKLIRKAKVLHGSCNDAASSALRDLGLDNYNA